MTSDQRWLDSTIAGLARWRGALVGRVLRFAPSEPQRLFALTLVIGAVCGLAAVGFHLSIRGLENAGIEALSTDRPPGWMAWVVVLPVAGGVISGLLLRYVVPAARGSGIPQVKVAYASTTGRVRLRDAIGKFLIGTIQIGSGASLGREGPTVQICSGVASAIGRLAGISPQSLRRLIPVGAAAGIAAAFNAPIAAVTFTIEEVVGNLDHTVLSGVVIAAALAAAVERSILGEHPVFDVPPGYGLQDARSLVVYALMGVAAAVVSVLFTDLLLAVRGRFKTMRAVPGALQPAVGGLVTGALAALTFRFLGVGGVTGGGYSSLGEALGGKLVVTTLLVLLAAKLVATAMSYGSGGAGGIFAPALFMGGMLGGAFGALDLALLNTASQDLGAFALVGMGAVFAGVIRAPITSVLIIVEMTGGYGLILPLMIANMTSWGIARHLRPAPIYEALLAQDGIDLQRHAVVDALSSVLVRGHMTEPGSAVLAPSTPASELVELAAVALGRRVVYPVVTADRKLVGLITGEEISLLVQEPDVAAVVAAADVMRAVVSVTPEDSLSTAFERMRTAELAQLPVIDATGRLLGVIDGGTIGHEYLLRHHPPLAAVPVR
jgi:CIC family chloride channel protein